MRAMRETADVPSNEIDQDTAYYDVLGPQLVGRRAVHIKHGEGIIKQFAFDKRSDRSLLHISLLENESYDLHERIWRSWVDGLKASDSHHSRHHHGPLTFKIPPQLLIEGTDRYGWVLIPEPFVGDDVDTAQQRILDSILNTPLTLDEKTLISTEPRLESTAGPQPGYYLGYLDLDSETEMIDKLVHGIDYAASTAIGYLLRGSHKANQRWVDHHLTGTPGDLWNGIIHFGLRDDIKESFARICVMLTKSGVKNRDNAGETAPFARRIIEATERRILNYLGNEITTLRNRSAA